MSPTRVDCLCLPTRPGLRRISRRLFMDSGSRAARTDEDAVLCVPSVVAPCCVLLYEQQFTLFVYALGPLSRAVARHMRSMPGQADLPIVGWVYVCQSCVCFFALEHCRCSVLGGMVVSRPVPGKCMYSIARVAIASNARGVCPCCVVHTAVVRPGLERAHPSRGLCRVEAATRFSSWT